MSAALIVLMPSVTGDLTEEHEGGSAAEKLVKLEELTHDFSRENPDPSFCCWRTVAIASLKVRLGSPYQMETMVGATGIEPVTPTMST